MNFEVNGESVNLSGDRLLHATVGNFSVVNAVLIAAKLKLVSVAAKLVDQSRRYHGELSPLTYADNLNDLVGKSIVALDVKRFITLNEGLSHSAQMTTDEGFDYLFNYGCRDEEGDSQDDVEVPELVLRAIGGSERLYGEKTLVLTDKQYTRNPRPKITIVGSVVEVETPAGMKAVIAPHQLQWYPEICAEVVSYVQEVLAGRCVTPKGMADVFRVVRTAIEKAIETGEPGKLGDAERFSLSQEGDAYVLKTVRKNGVSFMFILYRYSGEFVMMATSYPRRVFNEVTAHTELPVDYQLELIDLAEYLR